MSEHRCSLCEASQFPHLARKAREEQHGGRRIDVIYGVKDGKSRIQGLRYDAATWDAAAASKHCRARGGTFEAAEQEGRTMRTVLTKTPEAEAYEVREMSGTDLEKWFREHTDKAGNVTVETVIFGQAKLAKTEADDEFEWTLSDFSIDRDRERIDPNGWDLKSFRKNPVVLWSHNAWVPAIGMMKSVKVTKDEALSGRVKFDMNDPFAALIAGKVKDGFISAGSVGYQALQIEFPEEASVSAGDGKKPKEDARLIFRKQELWEFSICNIPANTNALVSRASLGAPAPSSGEEHVLPFPGAKTIHVPVADPSQLGRLQAIADELKKRGLLSAPLAFEPASPAAPLEEKEEKEGEEDCEEEPIKAFLEELKGEVTAMVGQALEAALEKMGGPAAAGEPEKETESAEKDIEGAAPAAQEADPPETGTPKAPEGPNYVETLFAASTRKTSGVETLFGKSQATPVEGLFGQPS